ncbi:hypothetical protein DNTS_002098 [Danionella cerebrum]|uniref:Uncharacterized protein n=1 Tax=Danionella cerebrum TaxID=2873325 RepID=A0A553QLS1_9TELE|nr:hypothetical protein DNTS_002098 [Danionella translucida]
MCRPVQMGFKANFHVKTPHAPKIPSEIGRADMRIKSQAASPGGGFLSSTLTGAQGSNLISLPCKHCTLVREEPAAVHALQPGSVQQAKPLCEYQTERNYNQALCGLTGAYVIAESCNICEETMSSSRGWCCHTMMMWLGSGSAWSVLDPGYWPVEAFRLPFSYQGQDTDREIAPNEPCSKGLQACHPSPYFPDLQGCQLQLSIETDGSSGVSSLALYCSTIFRQLTGAPFLIVSLALAQGTY